MQFVCDAPGRKTWFRIEAEAEAAQESEAMRHAVEKYFRREYEKARNSYQPSHSASIERDIGLHAHIQMTMPLFLTLRDHEGERLATAMLPPRGEDDRSFSMIIVGPGNADPYPTEGDAIEALGKHFGFALPRERCYPYKRA
jgi:hypothetical protein